MKKRTSEKESENEQISKDHSILVRRFIQEMEKKNAELEIAKAHLRDALHVAEVAKAEERQALAEVGSATKSNLYMEDHLKRLIRDRDQQIAEILTK